MSAELLFRPDIIVPAVVFAAPVAFYWVKRHYALLEKGMSADALPALQQRLSLLELRNAELLERMRGLERTISLLETGAAHKELPAPRTPSDE